MNLTLCFRAKKSAFFAHLENVARGAPRPAYTIKMRGERRGAMTRKRPKNEGTFAVNDLTLPWRAGFRSAAGWWRFARTPCPPPHRPSRHATSPLPRRSRACMPFHGLVNLRLDGQPQCPKWETITACQARDRAATATARCRFPLVRMPAVSRCGDNRGSRARSGISRAYTDRRLQPDGVPTNCCCPAAGRLPEFSNRTRRTALHSSVP